MDQPPIAATATAHLETFIAAFGRGGVNAAAIDLGVSHSMISHYRKGRKPPTPAMCVKIMALPIETRTLKEPAPMPDTADIDGPDASNVIAISHDLAELRHQVQNAETAQVFSLESDAPKVSIKPPEPSQQDVDLFMQMIWVPLHTHIGGFAGPDQARVIVASSQSPHGRAAAGVIQKNLDKYGVMDRLQEGHWSIDLGIVLTYAMGVRAAMKQADQPEQRRAA